MCTFSKFLDGWFNLTSRRFNLTFCKPTSRKRQRVTKVKFSLLDICCLCADTQIRSRKGYSFCRERRYKLSLFKRLGVDGPEPSLVFGNFGELMSKIWFYFVFLLFDILFITLTRREETSFVLFYFCLLYVIWIHRWVLRIYVLC